MSDPGDTMSDDIGPQSFFDSVPVSASDASDGLGDWAGIINPDYQNGPVFTDAQLDEVRRSPEMAALGIDLTQPPPDFLAGTGLAPSHANFDFGQYSKAMAMPASFGSAATGRNGGGVSDLVYRPVFGQTEASPTPISNAPLNGPIVMRELAAPSLDSAPGLNGMSPADVANAAIVTGSAAAQLQPTAAPQTNIGQLDPNVLNRADPETATFAPPPPMAPLPGSAVPTDAMSIAGSSSSSSSTTPPKFTDAPSSSVNAAADQVSNKPALTADNMDPSQTVVASGTKDPALFYPDPQKDVINVNGKIVPRLQAALNVQVTDDEAKTILEGAGGDSDIARKVEAIARIENVGNGYLKPGQTSGTGATGPLQIIPAIWQHYRGKEPLSDANNLKDAAQVTAQYIRDTETHTHSSDPAVAAADYVAGGKVANKVARGEVIDETHAQSAQYVRMMRGLMRDMPVRH